APCRTLPTQLSTGPALFGVSLSPCMKSWLPLSDDDVSCIRRSQQGERPLLMAHDKRGGRADDRDRVPHHRRGCRGVGSATLAAGLPDRARGRARPFPACAGAAAIHGGRCGEDPPGPWEATTPFLRTAPGEVRMIRSGGNALVGVPCRFPLCDEAHQA